MKNLAPIVLFTYKRLGKLRQCLDSLEKCKEAPFSDLIIISDYQTTEKDAAKVENVRQFLPSITGFQSIEIIEREKNYGVDYPIQNKKILDKMKKTLVNKYGVDNISKKIKKNE